MDLPIGGKMSLKLGDDSRQMEGVLVGVEAPRFIIVRLTKVIQDLPVEEDQSYSATYMSLGTIYRVHNSVLGYIKKLNLAVLSYPITFEQDNLRKEPRINCSIPATANIDKNALKGLITDISNHGCQFIVKIPATFKLYRISVLTDINLSLAMIGQSDPTYLKGKVRNTNIDEFKIALGIEFEKMEAQISSRLNHFLENLRVLQ